MRIVHAMGAISPVSVPHEWAHQFRAQGHEVREVDAVAGKLSFIPRFKQTVSEFKPHVVHFHHTLPSLSAAIPGLLDRSCRSVLTVHRLMNDMDLVAWIAHGLGGLSVDVVVANSKATLGSFPRIWIDCGVEKKVVYNGVDLSRLDRARRCRGTRKKQSPEIDILSVGRLISEKGFDLLIRGFATVTEQVSPSLKLTIVGSGPEDDRLHKLAHSLGVAPKIAFTGRLSREDVYHRLWSADVFALCSRTEGFCNSVVEAMAAGLPIVVTPAGALPEVVASCGWVSESIAIEDVVVALRSAVQVSEAKRQAVGNSAARRARREFTLRGTIDTYERIYRGLGKSRSERA